MDVVRQTGLDVDRLDVDRVLLVFVAGVVAGHGVHVVTVDVKAGLRVLKGQRSKLQLCPKSEHPHILSPPPHSHTHVVVEEVWVVVLDAVVQDGDHHVLPRVAPLPRPHDVHV